MTLEQKALQVVQEMLDSPCEDLCRETSFKHLPADRIEIILALEEVFGLDFPDSFFDEDETPRLRDVISFIEESLPFETTTT